MTLWQVLLNDALIDNNSRVMNYHHTDVKLDFSLEAAITRRLGETNTTTY